MFVPPGGKEWSFQDADTVLAGWDLREVVTVGAQHGAEPEDIIGCLFSYLRERFSNFTRVSIGSSSIFI